MSTRVVDAIECTCESEKCGHVWIPRVTKATQGRLPKQCPECTYRGWNKSEEVIRPAPYGKLIDKDGFVISDGTDFL